MFIYFNDLKKADSVLESIEGYQISKEQKLLMNTVSFHLTYIENSIKYLDDTIDSMVTPFESIITFMCTIPSIDRNSPITVISKIGNDVSLFGSSKHLCSCAGLTLGSNESQKEIGTHQPCRCLLKTCII